MKKINFVTLGCSKNVVDTEHMMAQAARAGYRLTFDDDSTDAKIVVINTCGFIADAKQESIDTILSFAAAKSRGEIDRLFVFGCLSERYADELREEIPEVDRYFGVHDFEGVLQALGVSYDPVAATERRLTTPSHYAYLKISEGCDRSCSYCAIPMIRGRHISVPMEDLVAQAEKLAQGGVKELILIAQDLTYYGIDLYGKHCLAELIRRLARIDGIRWIRLHYAYPNGFPEDVLEVMATEPKVCKYLDIPLQHISDRILRSMKRGSTRQEIDALLSRIREKVPGIALRTTLIVGYPGETQEEFDELKAWVSTQRFDRLGCFAYSQEEGTAAARLEDDVPPQEKQRRVEELMELQKQISYENNLARVGQTLNVLIDSCNENVFMGRTEYDSPEVDNDVFIDREKWRVPVGDFVKVNITSAGLYDLFGVPVP